MYCINVDTLFIVFIIQTYYYLSNSKEDILSIFSSKYAKYESMFFLSKYHILNHGLIKKHRNKRL